MSSINSNLNERLQAEALEAKETGLKKIASNIASVLKSEEIRKEGKYVYASEKFEQDVENALWSIIVRASDFHNKHIESKRAQELVETYAEAILKDFRKIAKVSENGAYEVPLPGLIEKE